MAGGSRSRRDLQLRQQVQTGLAAAAAGGNPCLARFWQSFRPTAACCRGLFRHPGTAPAPKKGPRQARDHHSASEARPGHCAPPRGLTRVLLSSQRPGHGRTRATNRAPRRSTYPAASEKASAGLSGQLRRPRERAEVRPLRLARGFGIEGQHALRGQRLAYRNHAGAGGCRRVQAGLSGAQPGRAPCKGKHLQGPGRQMGLVGHAAGLSPLLNHMRTANATCAPLNATAFSGQLRQSRRL